MTSSHWLQTPDAMRALRDQLARIPSVAQFDKPDEPQADTLTHSLVDLESSFRTVLDRLLPQLLDTSKSPEELRDILLELGEEFRHVLYHLRDPQFFAYLFEE